MSEIPFSETRDERLLIEEDNPSILIRQFEYQLNQMFIRYGIDMPDYYYDLYNRFKTSSSKLQQYAMLAIRTNRYMTLDIVKQELDVLIPEYQRLMIDYCIKIRVHIMNNIANNVPSDVWYIAYDVPSFSDIIFESSIYDSDSDSDTYINDDIYYVDIDTDTDDEY